MYRNLISFSIFLVIFILLMIPTDSLEVLSFYLIHCQIYVGLLEFNDFIIDNMSLFATQK